VRFPFLRNRGLGPASLKYKARAGVQKVVGQPGVSRRKLKSFADEMHRNQRTDLPRELPNSIALVVPCFGHADYLSDLFGSILAQTRPPDEVILVDDHSPDVTAEILRTIVSTYRQMADGRVVLLTNDRNLGQAASLNRAISAASSDLIMVVNDDDYLMHDAIGSMLDLFDRHRELALIGAGSIHFAGSEELAAAPKLISDLTASEPSLDFHRPEEVLGYRNYNDLNMTHTGSCFLKAAWEVVGGYSVDKRKRVVPFSDRDFQLRVASLWPVAVSNETPFSLWRRDSSVDVDLNS
jgi:GT2 family glycosyltransferase